MARCRGKGMCDDEMVPVPVEPRRMFAATIVASLIWTICLVGGVGILALSAMLAGGAIPFRYVGF